MHHHGGTEANLLIQKWHSFSPSVQLRKCSEQFRNTRRISYINLFFCEMSRKMHSKTYFMQVGHRKTEPKYFIKCWIIDIKNIAWIEIFVAHGFQWMGLTSSQLFLEPDDHAMGVEGAAYMVRYRQMQATSAMVKLVVSTFLVCV